MRPSEQLAGYLSGDLQLTDLDASCQSWAGFHIYKMATVALDSGDTRAALEALPDHIRADVRQEAIRIYKLGRL